MLAKEKILAKSAQAPANIEPKGLALCSRWIVSVVLALAAFGVFSPALKNDFVNYDDPEYVTSNPHITGGLNWENVVWAFTTGHASNWHPLTWVSHMTDWQIFGDRAWGHHLTNLLLHVANTVLLFLLLRRMTGAHWRSALVAGLFALHPLHVESVAWISERKDLLSGFFFFLTLMAYGRYAEGDGESKWGGSAASEKPLKGLGPSCDATSTHINVGVNENRNVIRSRVFWFCLSLLLFALGLMSKPMLVTVPCVLLLLDVWPLKRLTFLRSIWYELLLLLFAVGLICKLILIPIYYVPPLVSLPFVLLLQEHFLLRRLTLRNVFPLVEKLPFVMLASASSVVTFIVQRKGGAVSASISLGARISNALVSYARYLGKTFWPFDLSVLYPHPGQWPAGAVLGAGLLLIALTIAAVVFARNGGRKMDAGVWPRPWLLVGWLWFVGMLVPAIGLIQVGIQSMADRYTYLPLIGIFIILAWETGEVFESWGSGVSGEAHAINAFSVSAIVILLACGIRTAHQTTYWRSSESLFRHATRVTTKNYLAYNNLGYYLSNRGKIEEAMENYRRALEINPDYEDARNNLGYALAGQKKYAEAIGQYQIALRIKPSHVEVHNNLGNALSEIGHVDEAIEHYRFVLAHQPDHADAHNNLGIALAMQGKLDEAIPHFEAAIRYKKDYASAHSNLGNAFAAQHKLDDAIREYQIALRLKPDDPQAHNNFGNVLAEQGKLADAIPEYEQALRLNADNPEAHFNLGMILMRQGQREQAITHYKEALRLKPDYADAQRQLSIAMQGNATSK